MTDGTPAGTVEEWRRWDGYADGLTTVGEPSIFWGRSSAVWRSDGTTLGTWPLPVHGTTGVSGVEFVELERGASTSSARRMTKTRSASGRQPGVRYGRARRETRKGGPCSTGFQRFAYGLARAGNRLVLFTLEANGAYRMWRLRRHGGRDRGPAQLLSGRRRRLPRAPAFRSARRRPWFRAERRGSSSPTTASARGRLLANKRNGLGHTDGQGH